MKELLLFTVGKLKDTNLIAIEEEYKKRLSHLTLKIIECKAYEEDLEKESHNLLEKLEAEFRGHPIPIILLQEAGKEFDSVQFSKWLIDKPNKIAFIIGGASGHGQRIISKSTEKISLSKMTFPHQIARVLFIEQLYRAETIFKKHPYHK